MSPESIPDYLALVGDAADGIPGIARWGGSPQPKRYNAIRESRICPLDASQWDVRIRGLATMVRNLASGYEDVLLYKRLATLRTDVPLREGLADLEWAGVKRREFGRLCEALGAPRLMGLPHMWEEGE